MNVLIFANGVPPTRSLAQRLAAAHDLLLATDGAVHKALALGLSPDVVCGDFDSLDMRTAKKALPHAAFIATPDQNRADLEKAILLAIERGAVSITITGANGGRIDHTLANVALLRRYHARISLRLVEDGATTQAISNSGSYCLQIATQTGDTVSLIALEDGVQVSIRGVKWPLENAALPMGTLGVSNEAAGDVVVVTAHQGAVFVCHLAAQQEGKE